ncbi:unnamed protein product [Pedinophyceae sp. YPF-701]|nr:unnamed protein product [Pedinophyceae sp. YPF-701]
MRGVSRPNTRGCRSFALPGHRGCVERRPVRAVPGVPVRRCLLHRCAPAAARAMSSSAHRKSCDVAVVGAGAAGLAAAKELRSEGHSVVVFEAGEGVGGVWRYDERVDSDPLGRARDSSAVHSSMYQGLRTNLPRELMGYPDLPFHPMAMGDRSVDPRRFCGHSEVLAYLEVYAERFDLLPLIRLGTKVVSCRPGSEEGAHGRAWDVVTEGPGGATERSRFDAVVVCNGHYFQPRLPDVEVAEGFGGVVMHSHNYRNPEDFAGKVVLVLGASASGEDISRELTSSAAHVYLSARTWMNPQWGGDTAPTGDGGNLERVANLVRVDADGTAHFADGSASARPLDAVLYATGYHYAFPFLDEGAAEVRVEDNRVAPLYLDVFPPAQAPSLSFIGLPWKVVPFPQFSVQAAWVARVLSGRAAVPSREEMEAACAERYGALEADGVAQRHSHRQGEDQWAYNAMLADLGGEGMPRLSEWRARMYKATGLTKRAKPDLYRDVHDDAEWLRAAEEEFAAMVGGAKREQLAG